MSSSQSHPVKIADTARWLWVLILISGLFFYVARWQEVPVGAVTDDAFYVEMARSIAEGRGPVVATGPDVVPANPQIFPSGFPYLLSPLARLAPASLTVLSLVPLFAAFIVVLATWLLLARNTPPHLRWMTTLAIICNPWFISWSSRILSDLPYAAISMAALIVVLKAEDQKYRRLSTLLVAIFLCATAVSVRTIGWASVAAITTFLVVQRRWVIGLGFPVAVSIVLLPTWILGAQSSGPLTNAYNQQILGNSGSALWQLVVTNVSGYIAEIPIILVPVFGKPVSQFLDSQSLGYLYGAITLGLGTLAIWLAYKGTRVGFRNKDTAAQTKLITFYIFFYTLALAVFDGYPSGVQTRLLLPLLPFMIWLVLGGAKSINNRLTYWIFAAMIVASLTHNTWRVLHPLAINTEADGHGLVDLAQGANWINHNGQKTDVIMTQEPLVRHIHWQRNVVHFPAQITYDDLLMSCEKYAVRFVFIGPSVAGKPRALDAINLEMKQLLDTYPQRFSSAMADSQHGVFIYRYTPSAP